MAEATGLRNNALPYPVYGAPFGIVVPILDADGDLVTGASGLDSEVSKNGNTFADCTNEATEIATSSGFYYLLLTATEMTADVVAVIIKTSSSGAKTTPITLYPRKPVAIRSNTSASAGSLTSSIILDGSASALDDFYNGMVCIATIDGNVEARIISDYVGSTKAASVVPDWNVAPDNNDTFVIALPEGVQLNQANATAIAGAAVSTSTAQLGVNVVNFGGSAGTFASGRPEVNASHAGGTAWGSGAITANSIASNAFSAAKFASGAFDAVWSVAARLLTAGTNIALAKGTGVTGFTDLDAAGVRSAVGLSSANLDTQLDALPTANENADALLDRANGVESSWTLRQALRIIFAAIAGKASGLDTTTAVYRNVGDSKDRITATVDSDGNRSAVTLDAS